MIVGELNLLDIVTAIVSIATAFGVFLAARQIMLAKEQATTEFEDNLAREYREIALRLPVKALLGEELDEREYAEALEHFYHYIDLTNEEVCSVPQDLDRALKQYTLFGERGVRGTNGDSSAPNSRRRRCWKW